MSVIINAATREAIHSLFLSTIHYSVSGSYEGYKRVLSELTTEIANTDYNWGDSIKPTVINTYHTIVRCEFDSTGEAYSSRLSPQLAIHPAIASLMLLTNSSGSPSLTLDLTKIPGVFERYPLLNLYRDVARAHRWLDEELYPWLRCATKTQVLRCLPIEMLYARVKSSLSVSARGAIHALLAQPVSDSPRMPNKPAAYLQAQVLRKLALPKKAAMFVAQQEAALAFINHYEASTDKMLAQMGVVHPSLSTIRRCVVMNKHCYFVSALCYDDTIVGLPTYTQRILMRLPYEIPSLKEGVRYIHNHPALFDDDSREALCAIVDKSSQTVDKLLNDVREILTYTESERRQRVDYESIYLNGGLDIPNYILSAFARVSLGV